MSVHSSCRARARFLVMGSGFMLAVLATTRQAPAQIRAHGYIAGPLLSESDARLSTPPDSPAVNRYGSQSSYLVGTSVGTQADPVQTGSARYKRRDLGLAFGVNPFLKPRPQMINGHLQYFRTDFAGQMTNPANWSEISNLVGEYEMYIETLQAAAVYPAGLDLSALASGFNSQQMTVTFLVGGARPLDGVCSGSGRIAAQKDIAILRRWQNVGGHIDKLIADNSFKRYLKSANPPCYSNPDQFMHLVAAELADYFSAMHEAFPKVRFGVTDGFARFQVTDPTGTQTDTSLTYSATVAMPVFSFQTYLADLVQGMHEKGLKLDEFVMDCAESYVFDSRYRESKYIHQSRNYGRMIAGQKIIDAMGVASGVYWEVFPAKNEPDEDQQYHDLGLEQLTAFYRFGGHPRHNRFTYWTSSPSVTGPETVPDTALNDIYDSARAALSLDGR